MTSTELIEWCNGKDVTIHVTQRRIYSAIRHGAIKPRKNSAGHYEFDRFHGHAVLEIMRGKRARYT